MTMVYGERIAAKLVLAVVAAGTVPDSAWAAAAGDAIRAAEGPTFSANAADAVQETCLDLVANFAGGTGSETAEQNDLRVNCGNMVRTTLNVLSDGEAAVNEYGFSSETEVFAALRQFSGEETSSQGRYATETVNRQFSAVTARMSAIRQGSRAASGLSFNLEGMELLAHNADTAQAPLIGGNAGAAGDSGFAWFANFDYGFGDRDGTDNESEYEYDSYQVTFGIDYAWSSGWAVGGILSYSDHEVDFDSGGAVSPVAGGSMDTDGYTLSGFAQFQRDQFYLSGVVGYGALEHDMERRVRFTSSGAGASPDRLMVGNTDSDQIATQVTGGWLIGSGATTLDLYAGFDYLDIEVDGFTEDDTSVGGGLNLAFGGQDIESTQSILGAMVRHVIANDGGGVFVPYLGVEWRREFENDARVVDARYAQALGDINGNGASINFAMPTDEPDEDFGEVTLGLSLQMRNAMFLFVQWQSAVGLEDASANLITAGIRGTF
ncbi:MAG: autotransporter outer membrane beta-barrel domain-containing protein [Pseudomonadota bacterium]